MRFWLFFFTFFVFIVTVFEHVRLYVVCSAVFLLLSLIYFYYSTKKNYLKWVLLQCCYLIPIVSVFSFFYVYHSSYINEDLYQTSGVIIQGYRPNTYIYESGDGKKGLLRTQKKLFPGNTFEAIGRSLQPYVPGFISGVGSLSLSLEKMKFSYERRLYIKGHEQQFTAQQLAIVGNASLPSLDTIRSSLARRVVHIYGDGSSAGLLLGMFMGDISLIDKEIYRNFIDAGLVHIVAVSGANIFMLVCFLHLLLFFFPYYIRIGVILVCIIQYALLCGLDASVFRALLMGGMTLIVCVSGRSVSVRRLLAYAYVALLSIQPYSLVFDVGFGLSFLALIGIIFLRNRCMPRCVTLWKPFRYILMTYILPTVGATLGVTPLLLLSMGTTNLTSLLANILVLPFLPMLLILGLLSVFSPDTFLGVIASGRTTYGLESIISIARRSAPKGLFIHTSGTYSTIVFVAGRCLAIAVIGWQWYMKKKFMNI